MKNKIMRIMGVGAASLMALSSAAPAMAAVPSAGDGNMITVKGISSTDEATVKIYRVVEPVYGENGLTGYKTVDGITIKDIEKPTSDEVAAAVSAILANPEKFTSYKLEKNTEGAYTKSGIAPGEYIAIVSGSNTTVYNPAVVSINYTDANDALSTTGGEVDLGTTFANGSVAYMKSSTPSLDKNIVVGEDLVKGDTVDAAGTNTTEGDKIKFQIDSQLPSYKMTATAAEGGSQTVYKNPKFEISDKLDTTFANISKISVMNGAGAELVEGQDYTIEGGVGTQGFTITFTEAYLMDHGNEKVRITYETVLNDTALNNNYAENLNVATLKYSNDPTNKDSVETFKAKTYHYTFSIDGIIDGQTVTDQGTFNEESGVVETHEVNKVGQATKDIVTEWSEKKKGEDITTYSSMYALEGAEFTLYAGLDVNNKVTDPIAVSKSDAYGHIPFTGLDEGTYYMKETKAPAGYTLNDNLYKIEISANLDNEGVMTSYTVTTTVSVDNGKSFEAAGSITYKNTKSVVEDVDSENFGRVTNTIVTENDVPAEIVDTKLAALPSTGGIGTTVFTIAGVTMICGFAAVVLKNRKKN